MRQGCQASRWRVALAGFATCWLGAQSPTGPIGTILAEQSRSNFSIQGAGARAMGLGGAFIAVADDATAVSFNPAGLSQMIRPEISLVGRWVGRDVAYEDVSFRSGTREVLVSDSIISRTRFDPLLAAVSVPLRVAGRTLALQVSTQRLIPLAGRDSRDLQERAEDGVGSPAQLRQDIAQTGQIDVYSFAVSYEFSRRILAGISVNQWRGVWGLESLSTKESATTHSRLTFRQDSRLEGTNLRLGLLWRWPTWTFGLVHWTGFHADMTSSMNYRTRVADQETSSETDLETGLHWPSATGVGLALRPAEGWLVAMDLRRTRWSQARYMSSNRSLDGLGFFDMGRRGRTPDVVSFHLGTEYMWVTERGRVVPIRAGLSREPQPLVDRATGEQRVLKAASLGSGLRWGDQAFDLGYRYAWGERQASQFLDVDQILTRKAPPSIGREKVREHRVDLTLTFQFDRSAVERTLRHLFIGE